MPKRVIDFDAMWGSDKIAACAEWAQAEYAWLYGLADPSGCFELTNLRVIWGRVAAIRRNLTIERLEQVFGEFQDKGLLFVWEQDGKRYGHWTGSDVPGRLPPPSWRMRLERLAPPVPKKMLAEYVSRFARGRAASPGGGFLMGARGEEENLKFEISDLKNGEARREDERAGGVGERRAENCGECGGIGDRPAQPKSVCGGIREENGRLKSGSGGIRGARARLKDGVEEAHAQDLGLDFGLGWDWEGNGKEGEVRDRAGLAKAASGGAEVSQNLFSDLDSKATSNARSNANALLELNSNANSNASAGADRTAGITEMAGRECGKLLDADGGTGRRQDARGCVPSNTNADSLTKLSSIVDEFSRTNGMGQAERARRDSGAGSADSRMGGERFFAERTAARNSAYAAAYRDKAEQVARDLRVGEGPSSFGPVRVKPEVLERNRQRDAKRAGSRSP